MPPVAGEDTRWIVNGFWIRLPPLPAAMTRRATALPGSPGPPPTHRPAACCGSWASRPDCPSTPTASAMCVCACGAVSRARRCWWARISTPCGTAAAWTASMASVPVWKRCGHSPTKVSSLPATWSSSPLPKKKVPTSAAPAWAARPSPASSIRFQLRQHLPGQQGRHRRRRCGRPAADARRQWFGL